MKTFSQISARPALPYRNTMDALVSGCLAFVMALLLLANSYAFVGLRPFNASLYDLLSYPLMHPQDFLQILKDSSFRVSLWYFMIVGPALACGIVAFIYCNRIMDPYIHISGRRLLKGRAAKKAARRASAIAIANDKAGLRITLDWILSRAQEVQSILLAGAQGGGKTQVILNILKPILERGDKLLVFDLVKGDYSACIPGGGLVMISCWDRRGTVWHIAADIRSVADASSFAAGLIPVSDTDPMWGNAAQGILIGILLALIDQKGEDWGWEDLSALAFADIIDQKDLVDQYYPPASASVADAASKTTQSIKINLGAALAPIYRMAQVWGKLEKDRSKLFSLTEWLLDDNHKTRKVIVQGNARDPLLSGALTRAICELLTSRIASIEFPESRSRRMCWVLDEIPRAGRLNCISTLMEIGRSKGIYTIFGFQSIDQIRQIYLQHEDAKWMALFGIKIFPQVRGTESQKWVTDEVGMRVVERRQRSVSGKGAINDSYQRLEIPVIPPSELETELGPRKNSIRALVLGVGGDALILDFPKMFTAFPNIRPGFVPFKTPAQVSASGPVQLQNKLMNPAEPKLEPEVLQAEILQPDDFPPELPMMEKEEEEVSKEVVSNQLDGLAESAFGLPHGIVEVAETLLDLLPPEPGNVAEEPLEPVKSPSARKRKSRYAREME